MQIVEARTGRLQARRLGHLDLPPVVGDEDLEQVPQLKGRGNVYGIQRTQVSLAETTGVNEQRAVEGMKRDAFEDVRSGIE